MAFHHGVLGRFRGLYRFAFMKPCNNKGRFLPGEFWLQTLLFLFIIAF